MKYNVGDLFVDPVSKNGYILSYIFKIEHELHIDYYWMRYINTDYKDTHWIAEELDHWIKSDIIYYPVKT
jgi:hypothetical protein